MRVSERNSEMFSKALKASEKRNPSLKGELAIVRPKLEADWQKLFPGQIIELAKPHDLRALLRSSALAFHAHERRAVIELFGALAIMLHRPELKSAAQDASFYYSI